MNLDFDKYKEEQFCDNSDCEFYGSTREGNIKIKSRKHLQVYCNLCKNSWVITKGTFFYHLKTPLKKILEVLALLAEGIGVNALVRTMGITSDTLLHWLKKAAFHSNEVSALLKTQMKLTQCQIDEFWSFVYKKKESCPF